MMAGVEVVQGDDDSAPQLALPSAAYPPIPPPKVGHAFPHRRTALPQDICVPEKAGQKPHHVHPSVSIKQDFILSILIFYLDYILYVGFKVNLDRERGGEGKQLRLFLLACEACTDGIP